MDKIISKSDFVYQHPAPTGGGRLVLHAMGIHERMPPGRVRHGGAGFPYLLMGFHSPAWQGGAAAAGGLTVWTPGTWHDYGHAEQEWDHSWLIVDGAAVDAALAQHPLPVNELLFGGAVEIFGHYLTLLERELRFPNPDDELLAALVDLLFCELSRAARATRPPVPEALLRAVDYMRGHLAEPGSLPELAARAGWSVARFQVLFRECYGESPMRYWRGLRLREARRLLEYSGRSIKEIAARCGFNDPLHFSRCFRQAYGMPPGQLRLTNTVNFSQPFGL